MEDQNVIDEINEKLNIIDKVLTLISDDIRVINRNLEHIKQFIKTE